MTLTLRRLWFRLALWYDPSAVLARHNRTEAARQRAIRSRVTADGLRREIHARRDTLRDAATRSSERLKR